jgi:hypothetical protein
VTSRQRARRTLGAPSLALAVLGCFACTAALAGEPQVPINTEVVLASNKGSVIDPPALVKMKEQFSQKGFAFTSFRRLSNQSVVLQPSKHAEIKLPNQRMAIIKLDELKDGSASVEVIISQLPSNIVIASTILTLGREGSLFQHAGDYEGGQLILVLSPANPAKPRRGCARPPRAIWASKPLPSR